MMESVSESVEWRGAEGRRWREVVVVAAVAAGSSVAGAIVM